VAAATVTVGGCFSDPIAGTTNSTDQAESETSPITPGELGPISLANNAADGLISVSGGRYTWLPSGEQSGGYLGEWPEDSEYAGYFRFALPSAIPAGATILDARLEIHGAPVWEWQPSTDALDIALQDDADAPEVDAGSMYPYDINPDRVALLPPRVRWPEDGGLSWDETDWNESPDLSPLVQVLVDGHDGIEAGAHLQFWIAKTDLAASVASEVGFIEFSQNPAFSATLSLSFE
jgi:hypothetical protein